MNQNIVFIKLPDCAVGEWSEWDDCGEKCGRTTTIRRKVVNGDYAVWDAFVNGGFQDLTELKECPYIKACEITHDY